LGLDEVERRFEELTGYEVDIADEVTRSARDIASTVLDLSTDAIGTVTYHLLGLALALFLVYYLLKDGDDLLAWLYETVPLPGDLQREVTAEVKAVTWGVLFGHVFVGVVQGVVAGIGFAVVGIPNTLFWTAVMIVLAMIPLIGTIPIWGGAVVYLALTGEPNLAVGLFVYSVVVVGVTDDYLRPFAVDRYAKLNPAVILVGILGGAYAFGVMGLFIGPILIGALRATVEVGREHWGDLERFEVN
ncbi:MAG: AI-2E family transporter, partial [Halobacteriota archaeon]